MPESWGESNTKKLANKGPYFQVVEVVWVGGEVVVRIIRVEDAADRPAVRCRVARDDLAEVVPALN